MRNSFIRSSHFPCFEKKKKREKNCSNQKWLRLRFNQDTMKNMMWAEHEHIVCQINEKKKRKIWDDIHILNPRTVNFKNIESRNNWFEFIQAVDFFFFVLLAIVFVFFFCYLGLIFIFICVLFIYFFLFFVQLKDIQDLTYVT